MNSQKSSRRHLNGALRWSIVEESAARQNLADEGIDEKYEGVLNYTKISGKLSGAPQTSKQATLLRKGLIEVDLISKCINDGVKLGKRDYTASENDSDHAVHVALENSLNASDDLRVKNLVQNITNNNNIKPTPESTPINATTKESNSNLNEKNYVRNGDVASSMFATEGKDNTGSKPGNINPGGTSTNHVPPMNKESTYYPRSRPQSAGAVRNNSFTNITAAAAPYMNHSDVLPLYRKGSFLRRTQPLLSADKIRSATMGGNVFQTLSNGLGPSSAVFNLEDAKEAVYYGLNGSTGILGQTVNMTRATRPPSASLFRRNSSQNYSIDRNIIRPPSAKNKLYATIGNDHNKHTISGSLPVRPKRPTSAPLTRQTAFSSSVTDDRLNTVDYGVGKGRNHDWSHSNNNTNITMNHNTNNINSNRMKRPESPSLKPRSTSRFSERQATSNGSFHTTVAQTTTAASPSAASKISSNAAILNKEGKLCAAAQSLREKGNIAFQQKNYVESSDYYERAITAQAQHVVEHSLDPSPTDAILHCNRAAALLMQNKYEDALKDSLKTIKYDPSHIKGHWRAAKSHLYLGNSEQAKRLYHQAYRLSTISSADIHNNEASAIEAEMFAVDLSDRARSSIKKRQWHDALKAVNHLLTIFPPSGPCSLPWICMKCDVLIHIDPQEAVSTLGKICDNNTASDAATAEAWYLYGKALFYFTHDSQSTENSLKYLRKSNEIAQVCQSAEIISKSNSLLSTIETFSSLRDQGNNAYAMGKWSVAYDIYTRCLALDSSNKSLKAIILCNRAAVCVQSEKWGDAMDDINLSIYFDDQNPKAFTRRARIHQHNNDYDSAIHDIQSAIQILPSSDNQERLKEAIMQRTLFHSKRENDQSSSYGQQKSGNSFRFFFKGSGRHSFNRPGFKRPCSSGGERQSTASNSSNCHNQHRSATGFSFLSSSKSKPRPKTHYEKLGVAANADAKVLVKAFRDAALKWHPDKWVNGTDSQKQEAEAVFKEINLSYSVLKDNTKRKQYDQILAAF